MIQVDAQNVGEICMKQTIPSDYEPYISCDTAMFDQADMTIVVDPNTNEILLATMCSEQTKL